MPQAMNEYAFISDEQSVTSTVFHHYGHVGYGDDEGHLHLATRLHPPQVSFYDEDFARPSPLRTVSAASAASVPPWKGAIATTPHHDTKSSYFLPGCATSAHDNNEGRQEIMEAFSGRKTGPNGPNIQTYDEIILNPPPCSVKDLARKKIAAALKRVRESSSNAAVQRPLKIPRTQEQGSCLSRNYRSFLHHACCKPGVTVTQIKELLQKDPQAASRAVVLKSMKSVYNIRSGKVEKKLAREQYSYPINLAIRNKAISQVLVALIEAAPSVLSLRDGSMRESPLAVLLKNSPRDSATVDKMLLTNPDCVKMKDRHDNTILHVACAHGASAEVVRNLCIMFPEALEVLNFNNKTPTRLAQQLTVSCSEATYAELWKKQQRNEVFL